METNTDSIGPNSTMREVLSAFPGAQRALFRRFHIGGCSSCSFQPEETLVELCARNQQLSVLDVLDHIRSSHVQDEKLLISPVELAAQRTLNQALRLIDIRSREEFEAARIDGAILLSQPLMHEILSQWERETELVVYDHQGGQGLDAAAYFIGHGFQHVRALRGGIDAWSREVEARVPRYRLDYRST